MNNQLIFVEAYDECLFNLLRCISLYVAGTFELLRCNDFYEHPTKWNNFVAIKCHYNCKKKLI